MSFVHGMTLGGHLCEVLGLDKTKVTDITIRCSVSEAATVEVGYYVDSDEIGGLVSTLATYRLVADE